MAAFNKSQLESTRAQLAARFPGLFDLDKPVPLAVGIFLPLTKAFTRINPKALKATVGWLVVRRAYLRACVVGAPRRGLFGADGEVTPEQAAYALATLAKREAKEAARAK